VVETINRLQKTPEWKSTAVVLAYDDSDGWYDHRMGPIVNQSSDPTHDALTSDGTCGVTPRGSQAATRTGADTAHDNRCW
jgi:phospholipase C